MSFRTSWLAHTARSTATSVATIPQESNDTRRSHRYLPLLLALMLAWVAANPLGRLYAQEFRASITGQVTDSSGAVIAGASITAVNADTRVASSAKSDNQGSYSVLYILPGTYTVTVEAPHFEKAVYNNVVLDTAQQLGLNVTLKLGSTAQQVEVTVGALDLDTVSATVGGVVDEAKVKNMPSAGLEVFDDVIFTEGVRSGSTPGAFNITPRNNGNLYAVSGEQTDENAFYMNGAPVSDQGSWYFVPSVAATAQLQVGAFPYDAQYGRTGGGAISVNVKNGTNAYHGAVYEYYGNKALNANTWVADLTAIRKPINTRSTYGFETGGPIRKDKTFYFGSFEQFIQDEPGISEDSVPPTSWLTGDFAGSGYTIYDPLSTTCTKTNSTGGCTTYGRTAFPNDTIPASRISPIGQAILALYPAPKQAGATDNYVVAAPTNYGYLQYIIRIDQNFSQNTRMYGMFTHQHNNAYSAGNNFPNVAITSSTPTGNDYNIILDLTRVLSVSKVLDLKASYDHSSTLTVAGDAIKDNYLASKLGFDMPAVGTTSHQNIVPELVVTNMTQLFDNTENGTADADADFSGSMTQLIGHHSLHYGGEFEDVQTSPTGILGEPNGTFTFNSVYTQGNPLTAVTGQGNEIADILLGYPSSGSLTWDEPTFITLHYYGAYVQDNFHALPKLSLNLGLRWDVEKSPRDRHNRINDGFCLTCANPYTSQINYSTAPSLQNPLLGGLLFAGVNGAPSEPYKVQWSDWQPRVGFSWAALANTVVRGGYGIYYPWETPAVDDIGFSQTTSYVASLNGNLTPDNYFLSGTPYPGGAIAPTGASDGLATDAGNAITYNDTRRRLRMAQHYSFGIQRKIPGSILLAVDYLGTNIHSIPVTSDLGVIPTALQQACNVDGATCNTDVANPFYGVLATSTSLGASSTVPAWELARAYPLFNGVIEDRVPSGSSHFNSLNVHVERRVQNFNFVFSYAYANWMDRDSYLNGGTSGNFQDVNLTKELDSADIRHYVTFNFVYPLPTTSKKGIIGALANHWLFDSTAVWATGEPLELPSANYNCGSSYAPQGGQNRAHWFNNNESCWTPLGTWEPRTTPLYIGVLRDPSVTLWDPAFHKQFTLPRNMILQYRMEAENGANHPTWGAPSTTVATPASYSPSTSWTGFGTLPTSQSNVQRQIFASVEILF